MNRCKCAIETEIQRGGSASRTRRPIDLLLRAAMIEETHDARD
jgi:hypothetical protein